MIAQAGTSETAAALDPGPGAHERERLCVATHSVRPTSDLIRFVIGPDGEAVPDIKRKLPGRGLWVTATRAAVEEAVRAKAFARGFKREVRLPPDLALRVECLLERAALDALAIAGKAGLAAIGFAKAAAALGQEDVIGLVHAAEASAQGIGKLDAIRRRSERPIAVIGFFGSAQLDLALNRPNVIHAALLAGSASETFLTRCRRIERFRADDRRNRPEGGVKPSRPA